MREPVQKEKHTNILAEVLGNWVEFAFTVLKNGGKQYNTHKSVSIHQLKQVIVGALERRHAHIYVYSTHIRTCVKECVH